MNEASITPENQEQPKKSWKRTFWIIFGLIVIAAVAALVWLFNRPAEGVIRTVKRDPTPEERQAALPDGHFDGKYASFTYPGGYAERPTDPDTVSVEKAVFVASGSSSRILAVAVMEMHGKTLDDIPAYRLRNDVKKSQYAREKAETNDGAVAIVFTKQEEGYEKTAFILENGFLATVSVSSQAFADPERIKSDFEKIFSGFVLKK